MRWYDEFRVWNNSFPYNCSKTIVVPHGPEIGAWIPELLVTNDEKGWEITRSSDEKLAINSNGLTFFSPGGVFKTECSFDLSLFPFDTHHCSILIESWRYDDTMLRLEPYLKGFNFLRVQQLKQWTVSKGNYSFSNVDYLKVIKFSKATFWIVLQRKPGYYMLNTIVPSIVISLTQLISYSIPIRSDARLELSFTCILAYSMFQGYVAADLPRSADNPPLLSIFITTMSAYIFISTCFHGVARILYDFGKADATIPNFLEKRYWQSGKREWIHVAQKWDKISMSIYLLFIFLTPIVFLVIIPQVYSKSTV